MTKRIKYGPVNFYNFLGRYWFAYALSDTSYRIWDLKKYLPFTRKSYFIGEKARGIVLFDRAINGETLIKE